MTGQFDAVADPARHLLTVTASGFFSLDDVAALERSVRSALAGLPCEANQHVTLCDASGMRIQSQEVVAAFAAIARDPSLQSRRIAFVLGQSLARTQTRRLTDPSRPGVAYFDTAAEAKDWLFDGTIAAARNALRYPRATTGQAPAPARSIALPVQRLP